MITLKKWIHPTTGQVRLYANGDDISFKVWVEEISNTGLSTVQGKLPFLKYSKWDRELRFQENHHNEEFLDDEIREVWNFITEVGKKVIHTLNSGEELNGVSFASLVEIAE